MKRVVFTIAYGNRRYKEMAEVLKICMDRYCPNLEFRIYDERHISPMKVRNPVVPKDSRRGKLDICAQLQDPDTQYLYLDCDMFVFCDLSPLFDYIEKDSIIITWRKSPGGKWDSREDLDFPLRCNQAGIKGKIEAYHINGGFFLWQGGIDVFSKTLELFDNYDIPDWKGLKGDEYYICAAIQLTKTKPIPLQDIEKNPLRVYWLGNISVKNGILFSDFNEKQGLVQHYGSNHWDKPYVQQVARSILENSYEKIS